MCSGTSMTKNVKVEEVVAAPPSPPPLPPTKKGVGNKQKQGIVTILGSDNCPERSKAASIRRTLSADMSSKKWLSQNGFAAVAEEEEHHSSSSSSDGEEDEVKRRKISFDVWSSILQSQKTGDSSSPPYVHPLDKKSAASLTGKSLEICTESLGSETGSDCFSSNTPSESGDSAAADDDKDDHQSPQPELTFPQFPDENPAAKYSYTNKSPLPLPPPRSFPPPLPSLIKLDDKPSVRMQSRRQQGRLILEAVSIPSHNCFRADRQEGRLVLTFVNTPSSRKETEDWDTGEVFDETPEYKNNTKFDDNVYDEEEEEEEEEEEMGIHHVFEQTSKLLINVKSFIGIKSNKNKFNIPAAKLIEEEDDDDQTPLPPPQSLPAQPRLIPVPPPATAASFNAYNHFWRRNPTITTLVHIPTITDHHHHHHHQEYYNKVVTKCPNGEQQESIVLIRGRNYCNTNKANNNKFILPMLRGCKETRMSLLFWEPYCIATT